MAKEEKITSLAVFSIGAIVVIVGIVLLLQGKTGGVAIPTYTRGAVCWDSGAHACAASLACEGGIGGFLVGETTGNYECVCDEHLIPETLAQYGSFRQLGNLAYNPDHVKLIGKCRTY